MLVFVIFILSDNLSLDDKSLSFKFCPRLNFAQVNLRIVFEDVFLIL